MHDIWWDTVTGLFGPIQIKMWINIDSQMLNNFIRPNMQHKVTHYTVYHEDAMLVLYI